MINLDQVRTLEWKVKQAVQLIVQLRKENDMLRGRLSDTEVRLQELESMVETFKVTQSQMESGIRSALDELDHLDVDQAEAPPAPRFEEQHEAAAETEAEVPVEASLPETETEPEVITQVELEPAAETEAALDTDEAFDEEYAALVAEEAASLVDSPPAPERSAEDKPDEDRKPEQPGLGIF